jgi:phosphatidylglycerophosphate synthase
MSRAKTMADILTATRLLLAIFILLLGLFVGQEALGTVMMVQLLAWTTDVLDGSLARRDTSGKSTWWDDKDFPIDALLVLALFLYLTVSGFILPWFSIFYLSLAIILVSRFRSQEVAMSFMAPILALTLYLAFRHVPIWGVTTVAWCIVALVTGWPRFVYVVESFIEGMRALHPEGSEKEEPTNNTI